MYKLLLCLRYLRTRWIALASIVSVMLGVATLIVVNSVMGGFSSQMRQRLRGVLAHVIVEGGGLNGFEHADRWMERIRQEVGDQIAAMTPVVQSFGMLILEMPWGEHVPHPVQVIGVDPAGRQAVGKFGEYLRDPRNRRRPSFAVRDDVLRVTLERRAEQLWVSQARRRWTGGSGWPDTDRGRGTMIPEPTPGAAPLPPPVPDPLAPPGTSSSQQSAGDRSASPASGGYVPPPDPFGTSAPVGSDPVPLLEFDRTESEPERGVIIPWLLASYRDPVRKEDVELVPRGFEVNLIVPGTLSQLEPCYGRYVVVDHFKSGMSEYDQTNCYMDIRDLQRLRRMGDRVTSIQIALKDFRQAPQVVARLRSVLPLSFRVMTWEQKQGPLLAAVALETRLLNLLLFMIIAVAGFGILAIFSMIVVEKRRDIGVLKALGATDRGVQGIFIGYGMALGMVGAGLGTAIGLCIVFRLDQIEGWICRLTGREVFPRDLYYFDRIPTLIDPVSIGWIVAGALLIALAASVLPARRAAALRPVEVLRNE